MNEQTETEIERNLYGSFEAAAELILKDSLAEHEFQLCVNTLMITIEYLESKRMQRTFAV